MPELLEQLWAQVINLEPEGRWMDQASHPSTASKASPFRDIPSILARLLAAGASREDLGRIGRAQRYEACFGTLYALDDPGPGRRKLSTLAGLAEKAASSKGRAAENEFITALRELMDGAETEESIAGRIRDCAQKPTEPFADIGEALRRLSGRGATAEDFSRLATWHRYEACRQTLELAAATGATSAHDLVGLHESLLSTDPSGLEGRPGSWPEPAPEPATTRRPSRSGDPSTPLFKLKVRDDFAFTPDSQGIMVGRKLFDAATGELRLTCEAKGQLRGWPEFSPDSARSYHAVGDYGIIAYDLRTGQEVLQVQRRQSGMLQTFLAVPKTGEILVVDGAQTLNYSVLDPATLQPSRSVDLKRAGCPQHIVFAPDGSRVAFAPGSRVKVWRWPEAIDIWEADTDEQGCNFLSWSADSRRIAAGYERVVVFDAATGAELRRLTPATEYNYAALSGDGRHLVTGGSRGERIQIWDVDSGALVRELPLPGAVYQIGFSPDGTLLGVRDRGSSFWRFQPLVD